MEEVLSIDDEILDIDDQIARLSHRRDELLALKQSLLESLKTPITINVNSPSSSLNPDIDFSRTDFPWSNSIAQLAKSHWGITNFRHNQLVAINAVLSRRDVFMVAPTGGGKSLCFQLPALILPGITLVISPLISLMQDQVLGLEEMGIAGAALSSATPKNEAAAIKAAMLNGPGASSSTPARSSLKSQFKPIRSMIEFNAGSPSTKPGPTTSPVSTRKKRKLDPEELEEDEVVDGSNDAVSQWANRDIKLVYVTPEAVTAKRFMSLLEKMYTAKRLSAIAIDEAHCCSLDLTKKSSYLDVLECHDFRPDYKKLHVLKMVFPRTPIIALSATCPAHVRSNVISILNLPPPSPTGTLLLTSSLARANLLYSVIHKPSASPGAQIKQLTDWVLARNKPGECGIVYCLTRKDSATVADGIAKESKGKIKVGVYHADLDGKTRERVHRDWRRGAIHVVCATIAFGLGIHQPNVRFVIHHSISKSLEGYYQESGRAGRDGEPADCVLFFRGNDASRVSTMVVSESEGLKGLYAMLKYATTVSKCRRAVLEEYLADKNGVADCGSCDVCFGRDKKVSREEDVTAEARSLMKLLQALGEDGERVTFLGVLDVWRGGKRKSTGKNAKSSVNVDALRAKDEYLPPSNKRFSKEDCEIILLHLILEKYIKEDFHFTPYATHSYLTPAPRGTRLMSSGTSYSIKVELPSATQTEATKGPKKRVRRDQKGQSDEDSDVEEDKQPASKKRKKVVVLEDDEQESEENKSQEACVVKAKGKGPALTNDDWENDWESDGEVNRIADHRNDVFVISD
ncbi:P-loop containing nucleoside triphosphate hydrolase protein [Cladochytrium replicatum]|nr:P-loop containing nucleoside triphosphate hydrolase protein [Cladochytrium replicatum]